ncbi:MAG: 3-hydroxyacyl-CoA dehydrogenase [Myxococcaceae bacterium]|nr:3-hydroxyacyl-CoA dehydrogenase [Myxococcaceae bacterium]
MTIPIRRAGVIGAGVMGSGIAAHFANAGLEVVLLDIVPPNLKDDEKSKKSARDRFAAGGLEKAIKSKPAAFFHKGAARLVKTGNTEDDFDLLSGCDLVIEAIIEQIEAKRSLFERLEKVLPAHAIVASNTSGLRIHDMLEGRTPEFKKRVLVMHFFNPVRYMKLLELVAGPETDPKVFDLVTRFGEDVLGKGIVVGKDTPNFVGNRIGVYGSALATHLMVEDGLTPEDVDAITGTPMAHPRSATFRTADLVGLDTMSHVAQNCYDSLVDDEERDTFKMPAFLSTMLEKKLLGDKTKGGFYKKDGKSKLAFDYKTLDYRAAGGDEKIAAACKTLSKIENRSERFKKLVATEGPVGAFAWKVLSRQLAYSARRIPEICDSVVAIDDAMKWGYNWELGPFETWDALGFVETTDRMLKEGIALPDTIKKMRESGAKSFYREDGAVYDLVKGTYTPRAKDPRYATFDILKKSNTPVLENTGAAAYDLGDGVLGFQFKTKMNSLDGDVISLLNESIARAEQDFEGIVISNEGDNFSVGANLFLIVMTAQQKQFDTIAGIVKSLQDTMQRMKYARVPVVAAPFGMALGGGLEVCLAADAVQAAAETYSGLVEVGVGLIPGGGGNLNLLWRALEGFPEGATVNTYDIVTQVFKNIAMAKVATSAVEAQAFGYFRKNDGVSFDKARRVAEAKARVLGLAKSGYHPPTPRAYVLPGESGIATINMMVDTLTAGGFASEHDALIARKLGVVLNGGISGATHEVSEQEILDLEREAFVSLCGEPKTLERMQYMLMNNKPLRN